MKILLISMVFALHIWLSQGQNKFATCKREWTKIGCFHDRNKSSRPLPEMLLNDRDIHSKYHEPGYRLNWSKWTESIHSLACRCAERALKKGYNYFGLQFYGECWSGPQAQFNYSRDGKSDGCIMNLYPPTACVQAQDQECVGTRDINYIYKLKAKPIPQTKDIDGGYTPWSQWTQCSKSCGKGQKSRERTCTNPKPKGNGKSCDHLGDPEETTMCYNNCDVDGGYTPWSQWSKCSKSCGIGRKTRDRKCTNPKPEGNGKSCDHLGGPVMRGMCYHECNVCDKVMDVGIIMDSSSSVRRDNYEKVKNFLIKLVDELHVSHRMTHVGVIHYNHRAYLDWDFSSDRAQNAANLKAAIKGLKYGPGGTRTDKALEKSKAEMFQQSHGERPDVPGVLLVITDGKTSSRSKKYEEVLEPFKKEKVKVFAIGVGASVDKKELTDIAMGKAANVLHVDNFDELLSKFQEILKKFCAKKLSWQNY